MYSISQLKKIIKTSNGQDFPKYKIAVLGDTATQLLALAIKGYGLSEKIRLHVYEAEYDQIYTEVSFANSELYTFSPNYVLLYLSTEKLYDRFCKTPLQEKHLFAGIVAKEILTYWELLSKRLDCSILQYTFVECCDGVFGNFSCKLSRSFVFQLRELNLLLMNNAIDFKNVYFVDLCGLQSKFGRQFFFSEKFYYSAKIAISPETLPYVAKETIEVIKSSIGKIKKCIILDLDNTLWGGVIGDDGINNIQIGELGVGRAFSDFQAWLKQLKERGILLAVCSKNNHDVAKEPFENHPEMVLRLNDIALFVANWQDKATNIKHIQSVLNIGMDSMLFIDDNPFERDLVRSLIPEITVPELPSDPALYRSFLTEQNYFETVSISEQDATRTEKYQQESKRVEFKAQFQSLEDYLISLNMLGSAKPFDQFSVARIAQLTQRSNQFNLRTVRYTEEEIVQISSSSDYITLYFTLKDKFGDHGIISVVILKKLNDKTLFIDTWLMSCRVLKRTVEEFIVNKIINVAKENGFMNLVGEYIKTEKNGMAKNIYRNMGFKQKDNSLFEANIDTFLLNKTFVRSDKF